MAPSSSGTPLYVHVPFCVHKCPYCDFFSVEGAGQNQDAMVDTLLLEARQKGPRDPKTVFLGGGTPSYLAPETLERLLVGLQEATNYQRSAVEVTVECNPESLTPEKAALMVENGVNRLSIGIQSLHPATLAFFERPHGPEEALRAIETAQAAGLSSFSVDLIHSAPQEDTATFVGNLRQILDLRPPHLSVYGLIYEPGTPLHERLERGEFTPQDEDAELDNLEAVQSALLGAGYDQYEVSNFSTSGHQCRHNINYWRNGEYVGLGPSAVSLVAGRRFGNARSLGRWTQAVREQKSVPNWEETLAPRARLGETWWLGLRMMSGVDPARARATAGWPEPATGQPDLTPADPTPDESDPCLAEAEQLVQEGLLERAGQRYKLTPKGLPLADHVGRRFLA